MKKIYLLVFTIVLSASITASTTPNVDKPATKPLPNAKIIQIPVGSSGKTISLFELSKMSRAELEIITGKKMSYWERVAFNKAKRKLEKGIEPDGTVKDKKLAKAFNLQEKDRTRGFHGLGFVLGFFVGVVGVVLAYVIDDKEDKKNRVKWAWIGFAIGTVLTLGLYIILLSALV